MSVCPKCGKIVYFAERRTSLGKDWHRQCLRCEECGKVLHPGQHVEHKGIPYCHIPCYTALFGPNMYGHGSRIEAHTNFGGAHGSPKKDSPLRRTDLAARVNAYNASVDSKVLHLKMRDVNGRVVLEGVLRVFWGVSCPIQLKPKDDNPPPKSWRQSYSMAINNGLDDNLLQAMDDEDVEMLSNGRRSSLEEPTSPTESCLNSRRDLEKKFNTVSFRGERSSRNKRRKRLSIINNHIYDLDTSIFTPAHGTVTSVRVSSLSPAPEVIKLLLDKFKVENHPEAFCLYAVKGNGERRVLREADYPLVERVLLGPIEEEAKIFIMEKDKTHEVSSEVAQYVNLPDAMLKGFLEKYEQEEKEEIEQVKIKYHQRKKEIQKRIDLLVKKDRKKRQ